MDTLGAAGALITLAALFSWLNHRYIRQPVAVATLLFPLALSLVLVALGKLGVDSSWLAREAIGAIELDRALLDGMLSFLLFAGALHVDLAELAKRKWAIAFLASLGVVVSALIAGGALWWVFRALGHPLPLVWCLLFGALISPTDPIAVLAILKSANAEKTLAAKMAGESLFNDGFGIVLFVLFLGIAVSGEEASFAGVSLLFAREVLGGALFGLAIGYAAYRLLDGLDSYEVEILLTLALVMGGYAAAQALHLSAPIAVVVAGVMIGNRGLPRAMGERSRERVGQFWALIDEIFNAVLFIMIGLELLRLELHPT